MAAQRQTEVDNWPPAEVVGPPRPTVLRAPCPMCGEWIEIFADDRMSVTMRPLVRADGWRGWTYTISATGSGTHTHQDWRP